MYSGNRDRLVTLPPVYSVMTGELSVEYSKGNLLGSHQNRSNFHFNLSQQLLEAHGFSLGVVALWEWDEI